MFFVLPVAHQPHLSSHSSGSEWTGAQLRILVIHGPLKLPFRKKQRHQSDTGNDAIADKGLLHRFSVCAWAQMENFNQTKVISSHACPFNEVLRSKKSMLDCPSEENPEVSHSHWGITQHLFTKHRMNELPMEFDRRYS